MAVLDWFSLVLPSRRLNSNLTLRSVSLINIQNHHMFVLPPCTLLRYWQRAPELKQANDTARTASNVRRFGKHNQKQRPP